MNLFRRITATVNATVDQAVAQIENHDAVVSAALQDARKSAADAKVRLRRVQKDGQRLHSRCAQLRADIERWQTRARRSAAEDEQLALQCVARVQTAQRELAETEQAAATHQQQQKTLEQGLVVIQQRIARIEQQQRLLRTRQSSAQAQHLAAALEPLEGEGLDDVLDRWESAIVAKEDLPWDASQDVLDEEFRGAEDEAALRVALAELMSGEASADQPNSEQEK